MVGIAKLNVICPRLASPCEISLAIIIDNVDKILNVIYFFYLLFKHLRCGYLICLFELQVGAIILSFLDNNWFFLVNL